MDKKFGLFNSYLIIPIVAKITPTNYLLSNYILLIQGKKILNIIYKMWSI